MSFLRNVISFFIHCAVCLLITLLLIEGILRFFPVRQVPHTAELSDDNPIPRYVSNMSGTWSHDWNFSIVNTININNYGYVNNIDYDRNDSSPLIAVIGDSFVAAMMVPHDETFHGRLASYYKGSVRIYSFGLNGAPLSTYLKLAQFVDHEFHPDYILFTIVTNDYDQSYFRYKGFPAFYYFFEKPDGSLYLDKVDFFITPWRRNLVRASRLMAYLTQNVQIGDRIKDIMQRGDNSIHATSFDHHRLAESKQAIDFFLDQLIKTVSLDRSKLVFIVDAVPAFMYDQNETLESNSSFELALNSFFIERATSFEFPVISLQDIFTVHYRAHGLRFDYPTDGHWNPMAHEIVCTSIIDSRYLDFQFSTTLNNPVSQ